MKMEKQEEINISFVIEVLYHSSHNFRLNMFGFMVSLDNIVIFILNISGSLVF